MPPHTIGIIMDGNRRWAKAQGLNSLEGHTAGLEKMKEVINWSQEAGVKEVIFYAFSTENWNRAQDEVGHLMGLIEFAFGKWMDEILEKDVRVRVIGERNRLSEPLQEKMTTIEEKTKGAQKGTIVFALSYGGRTEILSAINSLLSTASTMSGEQITQEELESHMWSAGLADPDLIIRTGGEKRLSNFLTWQSVYSELAFTDTPWPALTHTEFTSMLSDFALRNRRLGV